MTTTVNGIPIELQDFHLDLSLLHYLREYLNLTGAKNGCEIGVCGSCTVLINDEALRSCRKKVADIVDKDVVTIEGMASAEGDLHPLQKAFLDAGAIQCGFCTPGMVLSAHSLLLKNNQPDRQQIRQALKGNLCRCTGYQQIVDAVEQAASFYRK